MTGTLLSVAIGKSIFAYLLMAVIAMASAVFIRVLVAGLARLGDHSSKRPPPPAPPGSGRPDAPAAPRVSGAIEPRVLAAIAAAVHCMMGAHRIVYIGETPPGAGWTTETRVRSHSHTPHHEP